MKTDNDSGVILVAVVCFTAITAILALGILTESGNQLKRANRQMNMEQAFYEAEGGAERAVSYITRVGVTTTTNITGSINSNGTYMTFIVPKGGSHTLSGSLEINPNNSPDNEFVLIKPDGATITRDDLANDNTVYDSEPCVYYSGPAMLIHVKPKGNGNQNTLIMDGTPYMVDNGTTYDFVGDMNVVVQCGRNPGNHHANGQWQLDSISGNDIAIADGSGAASAGTDEYEIHSIGTVNGIRRNVILNGVHQQSWAKYALFYSATEAGSKIVITTGSRFSGPVHANTKIYLSGDPGPIFEKLVTTTAGSWGDSNKKATFMEGYQFNAKSQSLASVSFPALKSNAFLIVTGATSIKFSDTNLYISNANRSWNFTNYAASNSNLLSSGSGLIYVASSGSGINRGTVSVAGTNLDGRLTIVADGDIQITNHLTYANTNITPGTTNISDDALGLIASNDVVVTRYAPNNLNIYAHIIALCPTNTSKHGFYVEGYDTYHSYDYLNVYGGIVEFTRGAVGNTVDHGYKKNYIYDLRFATEPPPAYPVITDEFVWDGWKDKTP